jgi:hypothetical protein
MARQVAPSQRKAMSKRTNPRREKVSDDSVLFEGVIGDFYTAMSI